MEDTPKVPEVTPEAEPVVPAEEVKE